MAKQEFTIPDRMGCGGIVGSTIFSCLLLILNASLVIAVGQVLQAVGPSWIRTDRALQGIYYAGPLVMLVIEWWLFDRVADLIERFSRKA
jgi:hypothetical protein